MALARYKSIVDDFALRIGNGSLRPGTQLPTLRKLMQQQGIALATASRVYAELEARGLVACEMGRGTFVRDTTLPRGLGLEQQTLQAGSIDLVFNYPTLPGQDELLREGLRSMASSGDLDALLHSAPQGGRMHERHTMARHLRNRGLRVPAEQVLIVNGAQQGLAISVLGLLMPGDILVMDAVSFPGMKILAQQARLDVEALPLHDDKLDLTALAALCRRRPVRAVYVMPSMHNPMGSVMSDAERKKLAQLAARYRFLIIEDAAYAFLAEPAPRPVFTYAPAQTVYVSGLSKSVASGLRIGMVVAPPALIPALETAIRVSSGNTPSLMVSLACQWIEAGVVDKLEVQKRKDARQRQRLARRILQGCHIRAHPSSYYLWLTLADGMRADQIAAALAQQGVMVSTADAFAAGTSAPQALRLALGSISMEALANALHKVQRLCCL
ncbi:PLP-dependent aminotransferase family protein [Undibacterium sp. CY18W]|uniref:PLP-dependent aminotransferase family protein n=1 Tax=Undibacterium hunanense TaxID=2762292 RepID=A0ABR6ZYS8_9BURK|nr:PLP-dependent aminotransferase family protein [Undibacterium hunanense]MBC3921032.1 PLP-dependent aminotransferase family protein [Undibacterium hunanense]